MTDTGHSGLQPSARLLWQSGPHSYPDFVFVTEAGDIGMKADFGRAVVRSVGQWCYLSKEAERLSAGYAAFPRDVAVVLSMMCDEEGVLPAKAIAEELHLSEKRVREIHRALKVLGLANFGVLCVEGDTYDAYVAHGSGYWTTLTGEQLSSALHASGIETEGRDHEDGRGAEHESPTEGDAQPLVTKGETNRG